MSYNRNGRDGYDSRGGDGYRSNGSSNGSQYNNGGYRSDDRRGDKYQGGRGGGYGNRREYDNCSRSSNSSGDGSSSYGSQNGGYRSGGRGGGGSRGGYQGGRGDLSHQMGRMNMNDRNGGGGGGNMYSQHRSQIPRSIHDGGDRSDLAGSAQYPRMPVAKKDLIYNTQEFAKRPKEWVYDKKAVGTKTELLTNHALVHLPENTIQLYCYNIEIINNKKPVTKREEAGPLFREIVRKNRRDFPNSNNFIFNDVNMLWTMTQLPRAEGSIGDRRVRLIYKYTSRVDFGQEIREDQDKQLISTLVDAIATQRARSGSNKFVVFKRCMYMIQDEREKEDEVMDAPLTVPLRYGVDARCGISIGIRINLRAGITACYDIAHTMFSRTGYPLIRLLCELINNEPISDEDFENDWDERLRNAVLTQGNINEMDRILRKMKLRYAQDTAITIDQNGKETIPSLSQYKNVGKEFKYHELTSGSAEKTRFTDNDGKTWSVAQFFLEVHHIRLRYPNLPCFIKKPSKMNNRFIAFPFEFVSYIAEPKRFEGGFVGDRMKRELTQYTAYNAPQRLALLQNIIGQKGIGDVPPAVDNTDSYMRNHKLTIDKEMLSVKATILPPPTVIYGEGSKFKDSEHEGTWEAVTNEPIRKVLEGSIYVRNKENKEDAPKLKKRLLGSIMHVGSPENGNAHMEYDPACYHRIMRAIESCGQPVAWENEKMGQAAIQGTFEYCQGVDDAYSVLEFFKKLKDNIDLKYKQNEDEVLIPFVLIVFQVKCSLLKNNRCGGGYINDYNFMKYLGDNELGIFTQGILVDNLSVIQESPIACKLTRLLVEKVLGKVGTTHRKLEREGDHKSWTKFTDPKSATLVLGVDVSHPSPRDRMENDIRKLSVATVVGNIDFDCTEYRASSRIQETGEENIVRFKDEINARLNDFIQNTSTRPSHIVVYRDGLAEGDFQRILYEERIAIEQCCIDLDVGYQPTITYIVVTKRHHTRFFLKNESEGKEEQGFNILPGTLVEDTVTTNDYYDFFLSTQIGQLGVARPTHYYVLYDTWKPMVSFWPTVTHALTYLFCRTTSTVSLPAPVLYAHLAAKRAKECLDGAWFVATQRGERLSVDNFRDINRLTAAINFNKDLDGMTFV